MNPCRCPRVVCRLQVFSRRKTKHRYVQRLNRKMAAIQERALRWKPSGAVVTTPPLPEGHKFHVFLSHDVRMLPVLGC